MEPSEKPQVKRLYRSRDDRVIAGVCGGVGRYFDLDPVIIRLAWIILAVFGGSGIILYLLAWLLVPREPMKEF